MVERGVRAGGFLNALVDNLPVELHIPGFRFCGPGTRVKERVARGDVGINRLDEACKEHDLTYNQHKDKETRQKADKVLIEKAWARFNAKNASIGEKAAAWIVTNAMKAKLHTGMGLKRKTKRVKKIGFHKAVITPVMRELKRGASHADAYALAKENVARIGKKHIRLPRVLAIPKRGGFLLPLISGLAALGGLIGAGSSIAKVVKEVHAAKDQLSEAKRHNAVLEAVAIGKKGSGLYVEPYRKGYGLFIRRKKNSKFPRRR